MVMRPCEHRRAMRVRSKGAIRVHHHDTLIRGRVVDLAVGGVRVRAEGTIPPCAGEPVTVELTLDPCPALAFSLLGHVLRPTVETRTFVVQFAEVPPEFEDCVNEELLASVDHELRPYMILVDAARSRRERIAGAFRDAGCHVTDVSTPLEAIVHLGRARFEPVVIAIADTLPESVAEELREFLCDDHPEAHMVAIGERWLSPDLQGQVEHVLATKLGRSR
jgi:hypothetical protein